MAAQAPIREDAQFYRGTDRKIRFTVYSTLPAPGVAGVCQDVASGWAFGWILAASKGAAPAVTKTSGSGIAVVGAFNASPALNLQRVEVTIEDADTNGIAAGEYWHELRRTDAGLEDVLAIGRVLVLDPVSVPA